MLWMFCGAFVLSVSYPPPPTHTFLKRPFLTYFKKYTHTPPPPYRMKFWCLGQKIEKTLKEHEFAPRWHVMNVPERYRLPTWQTESQQQEARVPCIPKLPCNETNIETSTSSAPTT